MRVIACFLLAASLAAAQQPVGPPSCPNARPNAPHPSPAEILQTQEKGTADPTVLAFPEPVGNMSTLRFQVRDYADCTGTTGCYWADLDAQTKRAAEIFENAVKNAPKSSKKALVLDIDETSLSSYCEEVRDDFGYIPDRFEAWLVSPDASIPIPGTVALAKRAQVLGVDVFFITGRPESQRIATANNLTAAGYSTWKNLYLKQPGVVYASTSSYKAGERKKIIDQGYIIILNIGDQWSDLQGAPMALHSVKLPNPFYYLP